MKKLSVFANPDRPVRLLPLTGLLVKVEGRRAARSAGLDRADGILAGAASHYREGEVTGVELIANYVSDDLACIVEVERGRAKVGGGKELVQVAGRSGPRSPWRAGDRAARSVR